MTSYLPALVSFWRRVDWLLVAAIIPLLGAGLVTMSSFLEAEQSYFFSRQLVWITVSLAVFFVFSFIDWRFLRRSGVLVTLFILACALLLLVTLVGRTVRGSQSWFSFCGVSLQPVDFVKPILILLLAKYFSRRHIEIGHFRHIFVSGIYALIPFVLVLWQPDFGSALIIFLIWLGMIMFSGISKRHLLLVFTAAVLVAVFFWFFVFQPYQQQRILTFLQPLTDIRGAGYSTFQSTIAVGSGQLFGKGVGYGTQSRLKFLPEYETDFIFAAFAEEWGFIGALFLFALFGIVIYRILMMSMRGATNFETLFGVGIIIWFVGHAVINIGMNIGLLPVTGLTLPFLSYGGSHLLAELMSLGMLVGMSNYARVYHRDDIKKEFLGLA